MRSAILAILMGTAVWMTVDLGEPTKSESRVIRSFPEEGK